MSSSLWIRRVLGGVVAILALGVVSSVPADWLDSEAHVPDIERAASHHGGGGWLFGTATLIEFDDFDSYAIGDLCGQSVWEEWPDRRGMDGCGVVARKAAFSGNQSLKIVGDPGGQFGFGDHVALPLDIFGGLYLFRVRTFVPETATGVSHILVWNDVETPRASVWVRLDADNDLVVSEPGGEQIPLIRGRWVELRARLNLGPQRAEVVYDGNRFSQSRTWEGRHRIEAISLYGGEPGEGTTGTFFDDVELLRIGDDCEPCDINCDGEINVFDIEPFLQAGCDPGACCSDCAGDVNRDGAWDAFDIEPFLECLFP